MKFLEKIAKKRIMEIINEWDPEGFLCSGAPITEYMPEVNMIYYGLKNGVEDTVYYTFRIMFESDAEENEKFYFSSEAFFKNIKFPDETRYDVFECREIETEIKSKLWWLK